MKSILRHREGHRTSRTGSLRAAALGAKHLDGVANVLVVAVVFVGFVLAASSENFVVVMSDGQARMVSILRYLPTVLGANARDVGRGMMGVAVIPVTRFHDACS